VKFSRESCNRTCDVDFSQCKFKAGPTPCSSLCLGFYLQEKGA
jgi:hypothetical protein